MKKPNRALGYARVSSIQQALGTSLQDQEASIRRYAESIGVPIARMYVEAESGIRQKNEQREQMLALQADVRAGDIVLCDKLDRWSRDTEWTLKSVREIQERGASFYAISDNCNPSTRDGHLMLTMWASMAQNEHARIKERLVGTRNLLRMKGLYADPQPPRGYHLKGYELIVDEEEAERVKRVFLASAMGRSLTQITKEEGLERSVVWRLLSNRYYLGETRDGRGGWQRGAHTPLITPELWQRSLDAIEERRRGGRRQRAGGSLTSTWLLRAIARCTCGARMSAAYGGSNKQYYRCAHRCGVPHVRVDECEPRAEHLVLERLEELRDEIARGPQAPRSGPRALDSVEVVAKLTAKRKRIVELYADGAIERDDMRRRLDRIDADIAKAQASGAPKVLSEKAKRSALRTVEVMRSAWEAAAPEVRREIVEHLAGAVVVAKGKAPKFAWRTVGEMVIDT